MKRILMYSHDTYINKIGGVIMFNKYLREIDSLISCDDSQLSQLHTRYKRSTDKNCFAHALIFLLLQKQKQLLLVGPNTKTAAHHFMLFAADDEDMVDLIAKTCESGCLDDVTDFYDSELQLKLNTHTDKPRKYAVTVSVIEM